MGLRHETICRIVDETNTVKHMRQDQKLSSKTLHQIHRELTDKKTGYTADKTRSEHIREILDAINHDERKSMHDHSTAISIDGLEKILEHLQKNNEEKNQSRSLLEKLKQKQVI